MLNQKAAAVGEADHPDLAQRYRMVRSVTRRLVEPLSAEDCMLQSMPDASPAKWHLAHTSWFFETFVLSRAGGTVFDPSFAVLFNSYYQSVGAQHPRPERGLLSRPSLATVWRYRAAVDEQMLSLLERGPLSQQTRAVIEIGLHHEQQHQELILTDIKHALSRNEALPSYGGAAHRSVRAPVQLSWRPFDGGLRSIGYRGADFAFDNERPLHRVFMEPFELSSRLVTAGEYLAFIDDGGYRRSELWLSEGWDWLGREGVTAPLYWLPDRQIYTLAGARALDAHEPVAHVSLYEADAYARWADARLPRECELEVVAQGSEVAGNFVETGELHPRAAAPDIAGMQQLFGDVWEWTQSSYAPYPGYRPPEGALGEYNGKFMCNQYVLRGGSCFSPESHLRPSYRNFFPAHARWQMSGIRLARDV